MRCGSFEGSSLEDRSYVTGDFGGNLALWDLEEERPVEEVAGAHSEMINCVTGTEGDRVVTGGRDGEVLIHAFVNKESILLTQMCFGFVCVGRRARVDGVLCGSKGCQKKWDSCLNIKCP